MGGDKTSCGDVGGGGGGAGGGAAAAAGGGAELAATASLTAFSFRFSFPVHALPAGPLRARAQENPAAQVQLVLAALPAGELEFDGHARPSLTACSGSKIVSVVN